MSIYKLKIFENTKIKKGVSLITRKFSLFAIDKYDYGIGHKIVNYKME